MRKRRAASSEVSARETPGELLRSDEPAIVYLTRTEVLDEEPDAPALRRLRKKIARTGVAPKLLKHKKTVQVPGGNNVYDKWQGAHWVLSQLADLRYPEGDASLKKMRDAVLEYWLQDLFYRDFEADRKKDAYLEPGVPVMGGRHRRCASQQGNALRFLIELGLDDDERVHELSSLLLKWQWPDGGWNCDKEPAADSSSFMETLYPMLGLHAYGTKYRHRAALRAAGEAAEVFLSRRLLFGRASGKLIRPEFAELHYPRYWHYDLLGGLLAMVKIGKIADPRCRDALDLLESKRLPSGGWPAEKKYYRVDSSFEPNADFVDWGGVNAKKPNPWVTVSALRVLRAAGRI